MPEVRKKKFLFVDDDANFLTLVREMFSGMSRGSWEISTAENHAQALKILNAQQVDVVVLDIGMPVMDGIQFLQLLRRSRPDQQIAMLTGRITEENRRTCLGHGAALFLEKVGTNDAFEAIFSALDALADTQPQSGFQGMMRRVGLQEVLQLECLGRKSSILEIFTRKASGRIFICDGDIVHAESNDHQGEGALYGLLALKGGEFNLRPYAEPTARTIAGHWEFLLMEAARLSDESAAAEEQAELSQLAEPIPEPREPPEPPQPPVPDYLLSQTPLEEVVVEELLLCSGAGEVLHEHQLKTLASRLRMLEQLDQQTTQISGLAPVGRFDRLEIQTNSGRTVCQLQPDRRLFVRCSVKPLA
jgi:CheY-like chemotaxis protein